MMSILRKLCLAFVFVSVPASVALAEVDPFSPAEPGTSKGSTCTDAPEPPPGGECPAVGYFSCSIDVYYSYRIIPQNAVGGIVWKDGDCKGKAAAIKDFLNRLPKQRERDGSDKPDLGSCDEDCPSPEVCTDKTLQIDSNQKIRSYFRLCHPKDANGYPDYTQNYYCITPDQSEAGSKKVTFTVGCGCCK